MSPAFAEFAATVRSLAPQTAVVLGSGLGEVAAAFRESASVPFGDIPGLVPTTVHGHKGRLAVGLWDGTSALLFSGRLHFYEGLPREVVAGTIRAAGELGVKRFILTNAAGGIHPSLGPGSLMALRAHLKLTDRSAWKRMADGAAPVGVYSERLLSLMPELHAGIYAMLTGPCYETPAEIRALAKLGADAVGMSTAYEAERAVEWGMEVAAISCITNKAAGLSGGPLDHAEVLANAKLAIGRLAALVGRLVTTRFD